MVPAYGESEFLIRCLRSILEFTPTGIAIYVCDDASPKRSIMDFLSERNFPIDRLNFIRREKNLGFLGNCNLFFKEMKNHHIVLVNSDVLVSIGWLEALLRPLEKYSNVATVTAMTNFGSIATVKLGEEELPELDEKALENLNIDLLSSPQPANAEIPVGVGHCILITAEALEIIGDFDDLFAPGYGEEVDFSIRATKFGFHHYLANTVVTHFGSKTFAEKSIQLKSRHNSLLNLKHSGFSELVQNLDLEHSQAESMFINVLSKFRKLRLLIDARLMSSEGTGTSRLIENTVRAISKKGHLEASILLREEDINYWRGKLSSKLKLVLVSEIKNTGFIFDVVYSPCQISEEVTMEEYKFWGRRVVIQQLDFIAYDNWKYFATVSSYNMYKNATNRTFDQADAVLYISNYVSTRAQELFRRTSKSDKVIFCGTDHFLEFSPTNFQHNRILVIGAGFAHKNLMYPIQLFETLQKTIKNPKLVFVGPKPTFGFDSDFWALIDKKSSDSSIEYHRWLSDEELKIEIARAQLILYPTTSEGFGFIPFEAAKMKRATLFHLNTSLREFFEGVPSKLVYSLETDVETIHNLLTNEEAYKSQVDFIEKVGNIFSWDQVGDSLEEVFQTVVLSKRYFSHSVRDIVEITDFKFYLLKYLGSRRIILILFPYFSNRRTKLISMIKERFQ
jgi:GT2 family glycosyltransferase